MGVTGLWTVVHPCARPIKIETLNKKRLAVDASIWIYQFLKAVRDKEGNQLRNSHIVGFFRRICKLLFIGIKPVFVFDGGAPALKRQTVNNRKRRREGRREDAARTAGKLLALQVQRTAEEEDRKRREANRHKNDVEEEAIPENVVYAEEIAMTQQERQRNRAFRRTDQYHLPELQMSMAEMGQPNDPRVMSLEELQEYANQFNDGEDINVYDFSKIDFDSMFFQSLPPSDRYNILNAARLRSRLRMGYSKDQLDSMFPDRMAFSRFQIERVKERNELTQRLIRLLGMNEDGTLTDGVGRVAGEKGREYVLVKNDGVEGGWALGVVTSSETGRKDRPINVDEYDKPKKAFFDNVDEEEEDEFEDVPIEGLNRLPKRPPQEYGLKDLLTATSRRRKDFYQDRREEALRRANQKKESDSLFVEQAPAMEIIDSEEHVEHEGEDTDLQKAISLSLQQEYPNSDEEDDYEEVFAPQRKAAKSVPFTRGSGTAIARMANARASKAFSGPFQDDSDDEDVDFQRTLTIVKRKQEARKEEPQTVKQSKSGNFPGFDGPLPFEKIDLGASLFDRKKPENPNETGGGFIVDDVNKAKVKNKDAVPLPPWFSAHDESVSENQTEQDMNAMADKGSHVDYVFETRPVSEKSQPDVIDLEKSESPKRVEFVELDQLEEFQPFVIQSEDSTQKVVPEALSNVDPSTTSKPIKDVMTEAEEEEMEWEDVHPPEDVSKGSAVEEIQPSLERKPGPLDFEEVEDVNEATLDLEEDIQDDHIKAEDDEYTYFDQEEDDLLRQLAQEEKEHERFTSSLNNRSDATNIVDFEKELKQLRNQQKKDRRDADEVTQNMITECQQLLSLFGLPYITAPMEAEAQCAELVHLGLVDGVVTDDSDIFLFGGTRVYKNMFNQAKLVECYLTTDLEAEFGLTRQRLISIAHLLGSDYTDGLPGVGPVTALEILSEFDDLSKFKEWWTAVQTGTQSKEIDTGSPFRRKFRKNSAKLFLPNAFPNRRVDEAYLHPEVDSDPSAFEWGVPDLNALRSFLMHTIGWSPERTDEVLVPVIRDMNRRDIEGTQSNITKFFEGTTGAGAFAPRQRAQGGSKRLRSALEKIGQRESGHHDDENDENIKKNTKRHRPQKK